MLLKEEYCSSEVKDSNFIAEFLISTIEQLGPTNVVQVIEDDALVCKVVGLIIESIYHCIFRTPCIAHNLNMILEDIEAKTTWTKEVIGQARDIIKFFTDYHQSQAIY